MPKTIAIAGSTERTVLLAQTLLDHPQFEIPWILTAKPKPVGRKKIISKNPLQLFAEKNDIPVVLVDGKIDKTVKQKLTNFSNFTNHLDLLLVVDFGYLIPDWLLKLPKIAPLNVHPSDLPRWRGSSPGQFVLLNGESKSAVCIMKMISKLDAGPIISKQFFDVEPHWTQTEYYQHSFQLVNKVLADKILALAAGEIKPQPQPANSPNPIARRLSKKDSFVEWSDVEQAIKGEHLDSNKPTQIERACRAYSPWPGLWTLVQTNKGEKRMKILSCSLENNKLQLEKVQLEGQQIAEWSEIKNGII